MQPSDCDKIQPTKLKTSRISFVGKFKIILIFKGAFMNDLLIESVKLGILPIIKKLIEQGANIHAEDDYAIRWAAWNGHLETVKYLVSQGANVHAGNDKAIKWAAQNGHLETVKYLVSQGANVSARDDYAIKWAAHNGHLETVKYLKSLG